MTYGHLFAGIVFLIFLLVLGLAIATMPRDRIDVTVPQKSNTQSPTTNTPAANPPAANPNSGYYTEPAVSQQIRVVYDGARFTPSLLTVPLGTTVYFENRSSNVFWPASNPHPDHSLYPVAGGCVASIFDACAPVPPGTAWGFRFDTRGSWGYHDHLNPGHSGKVVVQ